MFNEGFANLSVRVRVQEFKALVPRFRVRSTSPKITWKMKTYIGNTSWNSKEKAAKIARTP